VFELTLTNSELKAQVSEEDLIYCLFYTWHLKDGKYVYCNSVQLDKQPLHIIIASRMRLVFTAIDHADRNKLNCRRDNLRVATGSQNMCNRVTVPACTYRGVTWEPKQQKWQVIVVKNRKKHRYGLYNDPKEAALVYKKSAALLHCQFAVLNEVHDAV